MNGVELRDRLRVGIRVSLRCQRALAHIDDHPRYVQPAGFHLGKVDLVPKVHGVVALCREVSRANVVVAVEGDNPLVDAAGALDQVGLGLVRRLTRASGRGDERDEEAELRRNRSCVGKAHETPVCQVLRRAVIVVVA